MHLAEILVSVLLAACSGQVHSVNGGVENMEALFTNTLRISNESGSIDLFINGDGTYKSITTTGDEASGRWVGRGSLLCISQLEPLPPERFRKENCTEINGSKVGDAWESAVGNNRRVVMSIVAGQVGSR